MGRHGGDIKGLLNSLDYLSNMGFTAIWLNPILENNQDKYSYHGYSTTDYFKVDPRFGTNEEYRTLSEKANEKGIKIIMDMIMNHCGSGHWWMKDRGNMPMEEWLKRLEKVMLQQSPDKPYEAQEMAGGSLAVGFIDGIVPVKELIDTIVSDTEEILLNQIPNQFSPIDKDVSLKSGDY